MKKHTLNLQRRIQLSVLFGLICAILMSFSHFEAACNDMRTGILRLHIIANSNSEEDQQVKLKIRDALLNKSSQLFETDCNLESAVAVAEKALPEFQKTANDVLKENGFEYSAEAKVGDSYFETREYDDFTLPAGEYKSLIITLGEGKGKNWWCVVFPGVCIPSAAKGNLSDGISSGAASVAEHPDRYVMRFKTVELYEDFKKIIKK